MAGSLTLFRLEQLRGDGVSPPEGKVFVEASSAYEARALLSQLFGADPMSVIVARCDAEAPGPGDAVWVLPQGTAFVGDRATKRKVTQTKSRAR